MTAHGSLSHLDKLEAESIHIMRETSASFDRSALLYTCGKSSSVMLHLAMKAFDPDTSRFPLLHLDTTWEFPEVYDFRDRIVHGTQSELIVYESEDPHLLSMGSLAQAPSPDTRVAKNHMLQQALEKHSFDAVLAGRWYDKDGGSSVANVFSPCARSHRYNLKSQMPELWRIYNTYLSEGEYMQVFPLSNWSELDIWYYIGKENIPVVPLYFADWRQVVHRDGTLTIAADSRMQLVSGEELQKKMVRIDSLDSYPLTAAIESQADSAPAVICEKLVTRYCDENIRN